MHFLRVNVTFCDAVNMIYDVIRTISHFQKESTAKFMLVGVRNDKTQRIRHQKNLSKISNLVGRNNNFGEKIINSQKLVRYF